ncbi:MAG: CDP-alcohol phosphatidyltransferase family protein, partial [Pontixanthobacter sp.]
VDGVDGEIARATFRSSAAGARLDSLVDAATNLSFLAGVSVNLWGQGEGAAAIAGAAGLMVLAAGTALLGLRARRDGGDFTFDAVKRVAQERRSPIVQVLIWMTMRDFYALAAAIAILAGLAVPFVMLFAGIAAGWFGTVIFVLWRTR